MPTAADNLEDQRTWMSGRLAEAKDKLLGLQEAIAKATLELASGIESLRDDVPELDVGAFLSTECGIPRSEIQSYLKIAQAFRGNEELVVSRQISPGTMMSLAKSNAAVRAQALTRVSAGTRLDKSDVANIKSDLRRMALSQEEVVREDRLCLLNRRAAAAARAAARRLEPTIDALLNKIHAFFEWHLQPPHCDGHTELEIDPNSESYRRDYESIVADAEAALELFERLFGREHLPRSKWAEVHGRDELDADLCLAQAHEALKRFAAGKFGHLGHFEIPADDNCGIWFDIWHALTYLSPDVKTRGNPRLQALAAPPYRLRSVEICAGAGGQSIGLHAAGFDAVDLYEFDKSAAATLRKNMPRWDVVGSDVREVSFAQYEGIDLLAGGIPCQPYTRGGKGLGEMDERDLLKETVRIVREARPRAFFFENVEGLLHKIHSSHRARTTAAFAEIGYDVGIYRINAEDFGVGQSRKRVTLVGMPKGTLHRFQMPTMNHRVGIVERLQDLILIHRTPHEARPKDGATNAGYSEQQRDFDLWADYWMEAFRDKMAPAMYGLRGSPQADTAKRWRDAGLEMGPPVPHPPAPGDVTGLDYLPRPTIKVLQRLQDFPDEWKFCGEWSSQAKQLANAFPPRLARAIGLAIFSALEGVQFDIPQALRAPAMPTGMIGSRPPTRFGLRRRKRPYAELVAGQEEGEGRPWEAWKSRYPRWQPFPWDCPDYSDCA
ncbi:DNA cytosine methyltransferase [Sinorhizobium meliloti]|uniref:DNA cytosine methyltransferase n=1 Tax=Rhizobium meliloti TaxID=382 RepID=UPI000FD90E84|nr:DNA (cytosine-5-)-methyltransferase [Sinorhizobium meliloti]RVK42988.1 DNA (cytosine-5-)-methyltransferase [Sinorhizobium meliloti]